MAYGSPQTAYTSQVPDTQVLVGAGGHVGCDIACAVPGRITGVRYYRHAAAGGPGHTIRVWDAVGTLIASATTVGDSGAGWKTATLAAPVTVTAATYRVAAEFASADQAGRMSSATTIVSGDLTMTTQYQDTNAPNRPTVVSTRYWFVDFIFEASTPAYLVVNGIAAPTGDSVGVTYLGSERLVILLPDDLLGSENAVPITGQIWPRGNP